jgi:hypothetical protein
MKLSKQELEAVIAASPRSFVPFNKLVLSPTYQARPENPAAPLPLTELAASIEAAGRRATHVVATLTKGADNCPARAAAPSERVHARTIRGRGGGRLLFNATTLTTLRDSPGSPWLAAFPAA